MNYNYPKERTTTNIYYDDKQNRIVNRTSNTGNRYMDNKIEDNQIDEIRKIWGDISEDIKENELLKYMSIEDLLKLSQKDRIYRNLLKDPSVWIYLLFRDFSREKIQIPNPRLEYIRRYQTKIERDVRKRKQISDLLAIDPETAFWNLIQYIYPDSEYMLYNSDPITGLPYHEKIYKEAQELLSGFNKNDLLKLYEMFSNNSSKVYSTILSTNLQKAYPQLGRDDIQGLSNYVVTLGHNRFNSFIQNPFNEISRFRHLYFRKFSQKFNNDLTLFPAFSRSFTY